MFIVTASFSMPIEEEITYSDDDLLQQVLFEVHNNFLKNIGDATVLSENFHRSEDTIKVTLEIEPTTSKNEKLIQSNALLLKHWGKGAFNRVIINVKKRGEVDLCAVSDKLEDIEKLSSNIDNSTTLYVNFDGIQSNLGLMPSASRRISRRTIVRQVDMLLYTTLMKAGLTPIHQEICIPSRETAETLNTIKIVVSTRDEERLMGIKELINKLLSIYFIKVTITDYRTVSADLLFM